jgi:hypothetical protein
MDKSPMKQETLRRELPLTSGALLALMAMTTAVHGAPSKNSATAPAPKKRKKRGKLSKEGRAKIAAVQRKRWAAQRAKTA